MHEKGPERLPEETFEQHYADNRSVASRRRIEQQQSRKTMMNIKESLKKTTLERPLKYLWGKYLISLPEGKRFGEKYLEIKKLIKDTEFWSKDQLDNWQLHELKKIINHCYKCVPYYKELFVEHGINPHNIKYLEDIKKIPFLTKDIINNNKNRLIAENFPKKHLEYGTTGGSTGIPMGFYYDKRIHLAIERAFMTNQWERIGYKYRDKCVVLRGNVVKNIKKGHKYWFMDSSNNRLIMSSYHLADENMPLYIKKIREFKPLYIQAYPSALYLLVAYMKNNGEEPFKSVKGILCGSENLYDWQRNLFTETLKTKVYSWYGHSERVCLAGECERSSYYHAFPQYGFTELVNDQNEWCKHEGEKGEIVATGFWNYAFPLIRYRTQDIAVHTNITCPCERNYLLIKNIEGRLQEYVIGKNNERITLTALIFAQHFNAFQKIKTMQLLQKRKGEVDVLIVENDIMKDEDYEEITNKMKTASDFSLKVNVKITDEIPRTKSGKHSFLIQKLPIEIGD